MSASSWLVVDASATVPEACYKVSPKGTVPRVTEALAG